MPLPILTLAPPRYKRETRHDCHCGPGYLPDDHGSCQLCGRFPRQVVASLNAARKAPQRQRARAAA